MESIAAVSIRQVALRGMAAVHARLMPQRVGAEFSHYLDQVYAAARAGEVAVDGQNIFVYRDGPDGTVEVDFGVGVDAPFAASGVVRYVELPVGRVATATHIGDYRQLGAVHAAVVAWCRANGHALAGPRWEVYGHWVEGVPPQTDISYLLAE